jgi:hypothetical protein
MASTDVFLKISIDSYGTTLARLSLGDGKRIPIKQHSPRELQKVGNSQSEKDTATDK